MPCQLYSDGNFPGIHCPISWSKYILSLGDGLKLPTCRSNLRSSKASCWIWKAGKLGTLAEECVTWGVSCGTCLGLWTAFGAFLVALLGFFLPAAIFRNRKSSGVFDGGEGGGGGIDTCLVLTTFFGLTSCTCLAGLAPRRKGNLDCKKFENNAGFFFVLGNLCFCDLSWAASTMMERTSRRRSNDLTEARILSDVCRLTDAAALINSWSLSSSVWRSFVAWHLCRLALQ